MKHPRKYVQRICCLALAGCASGGPTTPVGVGEAFLNALGDGNLDAACQFVTYEYNQVPTAETKAQCHKDMERVAAEFKGHRYDVERARINADSASIDPSNVLVDEAAGNVRPIQMTRVNGRWYIFGFAQ